MTRRDFILGAVGGVVLGPAASLAPLAERRSLKLAVITDLHHGLAPDATARLRAFVEAAKKRPDIDLVLQLGDFCHPVPESREVLDLWSELKRPKIHVLGNHDMDRGDKATAMKNWGMASRYGSMVVEGYRFIWLDLNHFRKGGQLVDYANGNYFTDDAVFNLADPEQLDWLSRELRASKEPVVLLSHQPLGFAEPGQDLPIEQVEILKVITDAAVQNPKGSVAVSLFGHLHVDRLETFAGIPFYCVNSASYFWYQGMQAYTKPLFSFMELSPDGFLKIEGAAGEFVKPPPAASDPVIGRSGGIRPRSILLA